MLLKMVTGNRLHTGGILYRADRAYLVDEDQGMDLLDLTDNDMPKFSQTTKSRLDADIPIIDLTTTPARQKGAGEEGEDDELGEDGLTDEEREEEAAEEAERKEQEAENLKTQKANKRKELQRIAKAEKAEKAASAKKSGKGRTIKSPAKKSADSDVVKI